MAKKSIIAGEYIIQIADNGHVDVVRVFSNAKATMKDIARSKNFPVEEKWNTQDLGRHLVNEFGDGKTAQFNDITINKFPDGKIEIYQECKIVKKTLQDIAEKLGFEYSKDWNTQTFGSKLANYLVEHKEQADKILKTPYSKREKNEPIAQNSMCCQKNVTGVDMKANEHNEPERGRDFIVRFGGRGGVICYFYPCNTEELESAYDSLKEDDDSDAIREYIDKNFDNFPTYFGFFLPEVSNDEIYLTVKDENGESVYEGMHPVTWGFDDCVKKDEDSYFCDWKCDENMDPALKEHLLEKFEKYRNDDKSYDRHLFIDIPLAKAQSEIKGLDGSKCLVEFCLARFIFNEVYINIPQGENFNVNKLSLFFHDYADMIVRPIDTVSPIIKYDNTLYCQDCDPEVDIKSSFFGFATVFDEYEIGFEGGDFMGW